MRARVFLWADIPNSEKHPKLIELGFQLTMLQGDMLESSSPSCARSCCKCLSGEDNLTAVHPRSCSQLCDRSTATLSSGVLKLEYISHHFGNRCCTSCSAAKPGRHIIMRSGFRPVPVFRVAKDCQEVATFCTYRTPLRKSPDFQFRFQVQHVRSQYRQAL